MIIINKINNQGVINFRRNNNSKKQSFKTKKTKQKF